MNIMKPLSVVVSNPHIICHSCYCADFLFVVVGNCKRLCSFAFVFVGQTHAFLMQQRFAFIALVRAAGGRVA